jgi:hypothetical protein
LKNNHTLDLAACYQAEGWAIIPIPRLSDPIWKKKWASDRVSQKKRGKAPLELEWQKIRYPTHDSLKNDFGPRRDEKNIGVILGDPSGGLVDVDLDCLEAIELAPSVLPDTYRFGRKSKPGSHWLYKSDARSTEKWICGPVGKKETILELRSDGGQTVFPGSVHPSGESVEWEHVPRDMPFIPASTLRAFCQYIVNRVLIIRGEQVKTPTYKPSSAQTSSEKFASYDKAVIAFSANHPMPDRCPHCLRKDAWRVKEGKWFCFHSSHPPELGGEGRGCYCGDVVDIFAYGDGVSRGELLRKNGYLE